MTSSCWVCSYSSRAYYLMYLSFISLFNIHGNIIYVIYINIHGMREGLHVRNFFISIIIIDDHIVQKSFIDN